MKSCIDASSPFHATPMTSILPAHFLLVASTEGASALHVLQVGAQNQNATGLPANDAASMLDPPTSAELNASSGGMPLDAGEV
jgi:hypothetical protein